VRDQQLRLTAGHLTCVATLLPNANAQATWDAMPLQGRAKHWSDEMYFAVPSRRGDAQAQEEVQVGDLAYWPPANKGSTLEHSPEWSDGEIRARLSHAH
jgi:hypothetical protein